MSPNQNQEIEPFTEDGSGGNQAPVRPPSSCLKNPLEKYHAQLRGLDVNVHALTAKALQLPEVRRGQINELRKAIVADTYHADVKQTADAIFLYMLVTPLG